MACSNFPGGVPTIVDDLFCSVCLVLVNPKDFCTFGISLLLVGGANVPLVVI